MTIENRTGRSGIVEELIKLEASGSKGQTGVSLTSVPGETEYFLEMSESFAARGRLQVLTLEAAGRIAAMQLSLRGKEGIFALKTSYDESLRRFGPGVLLQLGSIEYFHESTDAQWLDSCTYADNELLLRLYPDRRPIVSYLVSLCGRLDSSFLRALPALRSLRSSVHSKRGRGQTESAVEPD